MARPLPLRCRRVGPARCLHRARTDGRQVEPQILSGLRRLDEDTATRRLADPSSREGRRCETARRRCPRCPRTPDDVSIDHDNRLTDVERTDRLQHLLADGDVRLAAASGCALVNWPPGISRLVATSPTPSSRKPCRSKIRAPRLKMWSSPPPNAATIRAERARCPNRSAGHSAPAAPWRRSARGPRTLQQLRARNS